ncbi:MAG: Hsp70 family protein, partial [Polyangiales bacterium]
MTNAVGIDLGTTNTVVAIIKDGVPTSLADDGGAKLIPSFVSFHPNGGVLVGRRARERRKIDAENTIYSVKRLIGRRWQSEEVQRAKGLFPFKLKESAEHLPLVVARGAAYALHTI